MRAESHLRGVDVRVLAEDENNEPVILNTHALGLEGAVLKTSRPLDYCGTRRSPRFAVTGDVSRTINGAPGRLVNLSSMGAQLIGLMCLRQAEQLRLALADQSAEVRVRGVVAWSVAEPTGAEVTYRAGVEFINPDSLTTFDEFCFRHMAAREDAVSTP